MKLASLKHGRDGRLVVVSRDLSRATDASGVAPTFQAAMDDWGAAEPRLTEIADALEAGRIAHIGFDPAKCAAPLPRGARSVSSCFSTTRATATSSRPSWRRVLGSCRPKARRRFPRWR